MQSGNEVSNNTNAEKETLDLVIIIGKDNPDQTHQHEFYKKIKKDCEQKGLKFRIIGDGKSDVKSEDLNNIPHARHAIIYGHGLVDNGQHKIVFEGNSFSNTSDAIMQVQEKTKARNIMLASCFGGKAVEDLKINLAKQKLIDETFLAAYSAPDDLSFAEDNELIISSFISKLNPGENLPTFGFVRDMLKAVRQTMVFGFMLNDALTSTTLHRNSSEEIYLEAEKFCEYQLSVFKEFIVDQFDHRAQLFIEQFKQEFPETHIQSGLDKAVIKDLVNQSFNLQASQAEMRSFQNTSIRSHIWHGDFKTIRSMIASHGGDMITVEHLSDAIGSLQDNRVSIEKRVGILSCILANCNFQHAQPVLSRIDLKNTNLSGIYLAKTTLKDAILSNAILSNANLSHADLAGSDLRGADLQDIDLTDANLSGVNLRGVKNLNIDALISTRSIMGIKMDKKTLNQLSDNELLKLQAKIKNDYLNYINSQENDITAILKMTDRLIKSESNPLKFSRKNGSNENFYGELVYAVNQKLETLSKKPLASSSPDSQSRQDFAEVQVNLYKMNKKIVSKNYTQLHYAAENGDMEKINFLLKTNQNDLHARSNRGLFPHDLAARNGFIEVYEKLFSMGSKSDDYTALDNAIDKGYSNVVNELLKSENYNLGINQYTKMRPIDRAASIANTEIYNEILKHMDKTIEHINSPLHFAIANGHDKIAHKLILMKIDQLLLDKNNQPDVKILEELKAGILKNNKLLKNQKIGRQDALNHIKNCADELSKISNKDKRLIFMQALKNKNIEEITQILKEGLDESNFFISDNKSPSVLVMAVYAATERNDTQLLEKIVEYMNHHQIDVNRNDKNDLSLLHYAVQYAIHFNNIKILEYLISNADKFKIKLDVQNSAGQTPLHQAVYFGSKDVVKILIDKGADSRIKDNRNLTPLDAAAEFKGYAKDEGDEEKVRTLTEIAKILESKKNSRLSNRNPGLGNNPNTLFHPHPVQGPLNPNPNNTIVPANTSNKNKM